MGTRASIAIKTSDGKFLTTAVNWDGYLSSLGKILFEHFSETESIYDMIKGGEIRSIDYNDVEDKVNVEYYGDNDSYPIVTTDWQDEFYSYLFDTETNKWIASFIDYDEEEDIQTELNMDLGEALEKYSHRH